MKSKLIYAPMLLLAMSAACGQKSDENKSSSEVSALKPGELASVSKDVRNLVNRLNSSAKAKTLIEDASEISNAAARGNVLGAAGGNAPVVFEGREAATEEGEGTGLLNPGEAVPFAFQTSLATGNPVIDGLCNKSFASVEALLFNGDQATFTTIGLKPTENATCLKQLTNYNVKIINELRDLNREFQFSLNVLDETGAATGAKTTFVVHRDFPTNFADIQALQWLWAYLDFYSFNEDLYELPAALEDVRLVQAELATLVAIPQETLTADQVQRINALQVRLPVVQGILTKTQSRLSKYVSLLNGSQFGYFVDILNKQVFAAPASAPAPAPTPAS